jgi:hypothetical protein
MNKPVLFKKGDQLYTQVQGEEKPITILLARFSKGLDSEISILHGENEIAMINGINELDEESQKFAIEEIQKNYVIPTIIRILKTEVFLGNRYIHSETNYGMRSFIIKNPYTSVYDVKPDGYVIRDAIGNIYKINSLNSLDNHSQKELKKIL